MLIGGFVCVGSQRRDLGNNPPRERPLSSFELIPRDEPKEGDASGIGRRIAALVQTAVAENATKKAKIAHGHNTVTYPIDLTCGW